MLTKDQAEKCIDEALKAESTKFWVKNVLVAALDSNDITEALRDAETLAHLLRQRSAAFAADERSVHP